MAFITDYMSPENTSIGNSSATFYPGLLTDRELWMHVIDDFKQSQFTLNNAATILLMCLYVPIFLTSLMGNILVLLVILPNQRMWTVTNNFLVNLALADLLVTVLCMPMTLAGKVYKLWVYGDVLCKMTPYLQGVSVTASTFTITIMSLDRCFAILHPVKFRNLRTKSNVRSLIVIIWVTAILLMIPLLFVNKTKSQEIFANFEIVTCAEEWSSVNQRRTYDLSLLFIICIIPAQIVFISYIRMGKRLWVTDRTLKGNGGPANSGGSQRGTIDAVRASRRRTAKMCIIVSIVFVVCWLPYYTVNIYLDFYRNQDVLDIVYWGLLIGHLHCITNPILYCFMHKTFRYCVKRMLPCWRGAIHRTPSGYGTNNISCRRTGSVITSTIRSSPGNNNSSPEVRGSLRSHLRASRSVSDSPLSEGDPSSHRYVTCTQTRPRKVRLLLRRLRVRRPASGDSLTEHLAENVRLVNIPSAITEDNTNTDV